MSHQEPLLRLQASSQTPNHIRLQAYACIYGYKPTGLRVQTGTQTTKQRGWGRGLCGGGGVAVDDSHLSTYRHMHLCVVVGASTAVVNGHLSTYRHMHLSTCSPLFISFLIPSPSSPTTRYHHYHPVRCASHAAALLWVRGVSRPFSRRSFACSSLTTTHPSPSPTSPPPPSSAYSLSARCGRSSLRRRRRRHALWRWRCGSCARRHRTRAKT